MPSVSHAQGEFQFPADDSASESIPASIPTKLCTWCNAVKPVDEFFVNTRDRTKRLAGCKTCRVARNKELYQSDPERYRAYQRKFVAENPEKVKESTKRSRKKHIQRVRATERAYKAANHEKIKAKKERYRKRRKHVVNAGHARYRETNHDLLQARHKLWRDTHPERSREILSDAKHRRRARLAGGGGSHTSAEWLELKAFYNFTCLMCGRSEPEIKLTRDHVKPLSLGGTNDIENIQPLCKSCNSRKHAQTIDLR